MRSLGRSLWRHHLDRLRDPLLFHVAEEVPAVEATVAAAVINHLERHLTIATYDITKAGDTDLTIRRQAV